MCSMPTLRRIISGLTPALFCSSAGICRWVVEAGWQARDLASPKLTSRNLRSRVTDPAVTKSLNLQVEQGCSMIGAIERIRDGLIDPDCDGLRRRLDLVAVVDGLCGVLSRSRPARRVQSARDNRRATFAIVKTGLGPKEDDIGLRRNELKFYWQDIPEAHLSPRPDRVQQNASSNLHLTSVDHLASVVYDLIREFIFTPKCGLIAS